MYQQCKVDFKFSPPTPPPRLLPSLSTLTAYIPARTITAQTCNGSYEYMEIWLPEKKPLSQLRSLRTAIP